MENKPSEAFIAWTDFKYEVQKPFVRLLDFILRVSNWIKERRNGR